MTQKIQIPLLKDHHNHLTIYGLLHHCLNLQTVKEKTEAIKQMQTLDKEKVSVVLGWNTSCFKFTDEDLERLPPVIIVNISLHNFIMNSAAEERLKERYPEIVANHRNAKWYEDHFTRMMLFLAGLVEPREEVFKCFFDFLYQRGIYYLEDMILSSEASYRIIGSSPFRERTAFWADLGTFKTLSAGAQKDIKGIKLFTDGAVGARTAALGHPYRDGGEGYLLHSDDAFYRIMQEAAAYKKAISVHAIGNMASAQVVRTLKELKHNGSEFPLIRMEHCQFINEKTACEAKELGIVLSMQPNFSSDSVDYKDRLFPQYLKNNNPFRMLIDKAGFVPGEDLIFGSDGMPHGAEAALKFSLFPPFPQQKLTLEEFIAGYCMPDQTYGNIDVEMDQENQYISMSVSQ
ncbi:MAG: amidohydrolase family protein [Candidatus Aminicenantes bacterium]|nr:amidohydrolase family protein [Candidatus Aminicenantes bacterium]NIM83981.1 amidohydrolase family protein [Candidatus Aminicenantes bacterium]NIN23459.1 amidohydrolase family protein [Candidatus Aminicenantes bacterium]NIN47164.1 amidohydrolase family protein [Candidatus Aminicenantes bacterium]NIN90088.1 amidohydrolase family protein [Candidatus Aminicenantes bacterium]